MNGGTTRNMYSHGSSANGWFVRKLVVARAVVCMQCCVVLCPTKKVLLFMNTCPRKRALVPCNDRNRRIGAQTLVWYPSVGTGTSTYQLQDYVADGAISYCLNVRCLLRCWLCICANSWSIRPSPLLPRFVYATSVHNWLHLEYTLAVSSLPCLSVQFRAGAQPTDICWWRKFRRRRERGGRGG